MNPSIAVSASSGTTEMDVLLDSGNLLGDCCSIQFYNEHPELFEVAAGGNCTTVRGMQADGVTPVKIEKEAMVKIRLKYKDRNKTLHIPVYITDIKRDCIIGLSTLITHAYDFYTHVLEGWHKLAMAKMLDGTPREFCSILRADWRENSMEEVNQKLVHASGAGKVEIYNDPIKKWGVRVRKDIPDKHLKKGMLVLPYSRCIGKRLEEEQDPKWLPDYTMELGDKRFGASDDTREFAPFINDALEDEQQNMQAELSDSGRLQFKNTRELEPGEPLHIAYGPEFWIKHLKENRAQKNEEQLEELLERVREYYRSTDKTTIEALAICQLSDYDDLQRAFSVYPNDALEEEDIAETLIYPSDIASIDLSVPYKDRVQEFLDTYHKKVHGQFMDHPGVKELFNSLGADVFVPKNWDGLIDENGKPWVFRIQWKEAPADIKRKSAFINEKLYEIVKLEFERLTLAKFFVDSDSPVASRLVVAPKATDPFVRLCGDFSPINKDMANSQVDIPLVFQELHKVAKSSVFANIDMTNAFHQLLIDETSSNRLSIATPFGQFRPRFLPEGIKVASQILQKAMKTIFKPMGEDCIVMFDNFLVLADDYEDLRKKLTKFFSICKKHNLFLKLSKSDFAVRETPFFGYTVRKNSFVIEECRLKALDDLPFPPDTDKCNTPAKKLQSMQVYLGITQFVAPFVPGYAGITAKLHEMIHQSFSWEEKNWAEDYRSIWNNHRNMVKQVYALNYPDYSLDWVLRVDASQIGCGGVLLQIRINDEGEHVYEPLMLFSHKFTDAATRWQISDQEAYGIYHGVHKARHLLLGKPFILETDHRNLLWMEKSKIPKINRMVSFLTSFEIWVRHIPGVDNDAADGLSRLMRGMEPEEFNQADESMNVVDMDDNIWKQVHGYEMGHHGVKRTWEMLNKYHPGHAYSLEDVKYYVDQCAICQKYREPFETSIKPLVKTLIKQHPRSTVAIDTCTMQEDRNGNKYILVFVNMFTKIIQIYPTIDKSAETTANKLILYIGSFGLVDTVHSDQGSDFMSKLQSQVLRKFGILRSHTITYSPWSSGAEPSVKKASYHIRTLCADKEWADRWSDDHIIGAAIMNCNEPVHTSTGISPYEATFGTENARYYDFGADQVDTTSKEAMVSYMKILNKDFKRMKQLSIEFQEAYKQKKTACNEGHEQQLYHEGDLVLTKGDKNRRNSKLEAVKQGPFAVVDHVKGHNTVRIRSLVTNKVTDANCVDLQIFTGTQAEATKLSRLDNREVEIEEILGYKGNPVDGRSSTTWIVKWLGEESTTEEPWSGIEQTIALEKYCSTQPILQRLLIPTKQLAEYDRINIAKHTPLPVDTIVYVDLRSFCYPWYDQREDLPDRATTKYRVQAVYRSYNGKKRLEAEVFFPAYGVTYKLPQKWMVYHGNATTLGPDEVLLSADDLRKYNAVNYISFMTDDDQTRERLIKHRLLTNKKAIAAEMRPYRYPDADYPLKKRFKK